MSAVRSVTVRIRAASRLVTELDGQINLVRISR